MDTGAFEDMVQAHQQEIQEFARRQADLEIGKGKTRQKGSSLRRALKQVLALPEHRVGQINLLDYTD